MSSLEEAGRQSIIEELEALRAKLINEAKSDSEMLESLLELAFREMTIASEHIDCPYCSKHMRLEAEEIRRVLKHLREQGNSVHKHGLRERLEVLVSSLKIFYNVVLGGLHRAGLI